MDVETLKDLMTAESLRREQVEYSTDGRSWIERNSVVETLNRGNAVHLADGSIVTMPWDDNDEIFYNADCDGSPIEHVRDEDGWYVDYSEGGKRRIDVSTKDGNTYSFIMSYFYDSWDNGCSDEWTFANVEGVSDE